MFDSLNGGYVPICAVVVIAAWFVAGVRSVYIRVVAALLVPVAISLAWYFVPAMFQGFTEEGWVGWSYITAATWSLVAVPLSVVAVFFFGYVRNRHRRLV
jgi:hypothetical protein